MSSILRGYVRKYKKLIFITGVVGGTIAVFYYGKNKLQKIQENQAREFIERTRRLDHFESTERTCNQVIVSLNSNLLTEIEKLLNTNDILEKLRRNPENKVELWENLKIISFTRLTVLIYATSMLILVLRIQLNVLGGYLFKDTKTENVKVTEEIRQSYLSLIQYFLTDGLNDLVDHIKSKITEILDSYPLNKKLNLADIEQIFWSTQMAVNNGNKDPNSKISKYVFPNSINETGLLQKMYNETLDILEMEDVGILCSNIVSRGFSIAVDKIAEQYSVITKSNEMTEKTISSKDELNVALKMNKTGLHLAKIIPIISGITSNTLSASSNSTNLTKLLVTCFLISEKVKTLGANVYEVFSH